AATPTPYVYFMSIMLSSHRHLRNLHSFPTRRSSDLGDNSRSEQYKETKLEDLKRRMGNAVLAEMRNHVRNERSFDKSGRGVRGRSEEHTSELQSRFDLVCRLLLEKKKIHK